MTSLRSIIVTSLTLLAPTLALANRPVKILTFEELNAKADLVVIATAASEPRATPEINDFPGGLHESMERIITELNVKTVLKGELKDKQVQLAHYRFKEEKKEQIVVNGPGLVTLWHKDKQRRFTYLLFLRKQADGSFEPLSGRMDPRFSVFVLADSGLVGYVKHPGRLINR